jgi:hypothetical protein
MGGRAVEGTGLENRQTRKRLEGSNPSPSAKFPPRRKGLGDGRQDLKNGQLGSGA